MDYFTFVIDYIFQTNELINDLFHIQKSKTGIQKNRLNRRFFCDFWSEWRDSNARPDGPKPSVLPTAPHPDIQFSAMIAEKKRKRKSFVSVGSAVVKGNFEAAFQIQPTLLLLLSKTLPGLPFKDNG